MKKIICIFFSILFLSMTLLGCSKSEDKLREELKAEIKAEMEAENKAKEESKSKQEAEEPSIENKDNSQKDQPNDQKPIIDDESPEYAENNADGKHNLKGFKNETINGTLVNYDEHIAVIVPMYDGVNKNNLGLHSWNIGPGAATELTFAVFGRMYDVTINYIEGMDSEVITEKANDFENELVTIKTQLPSDMSCIKITGKVMGGEGFEQNIEFTLDDMRDVSDYETIVIDY